MPELEQPSVEPSVLYMCYFAVHNDDAFVARIETACILNNLPEPDIRFLTHVARKVAKGLHIDEEGLLHSEDISDDDIIGAVKTVAKSEKGPEDA